MTANEMADNLLIQLDRAASGGSPGYEDVELSAILTKAQYHFVKSIISPLTNMKREGMEESEVRNQGLSALTTATSLTPSIAASNNLTNGVFVNLPEDFMLSILEQAVITKLDCNSVPLTVPVWVISHNEYNQLVSNPYKKPFAKKYEGLIWRLQIGRENDGNLSIASQTAKRHELVTDGTFSVTTYKLRYLKTPPKIVVDFSNTALQRHCILDEATHEAVIEIAVKMLKTITDRQVIPNIQSIENIE